MNWFAVGLLLAVVLILGWSDPTRPQPPSTNAADKAREAGL